MSMDVLPPGGEGELRLAFDMSLDTSSLRSGTLDANLTLAPLGGIYDSGMRLRLSAGASWYRYLANDNPREIGSGWNTEASALLGYGLALRRASFVMLVGPSVSEGKNQGIKRSATGAKAVISVYARPTDDSMAYASLTHSTIQSTTRVQAKFGLRSVADTYIGPETSLAWSRDDPRITRDLLRTLGVHVSSMRMGPWYAGVSAGRTRDHDLGYGYYLALGIYGAF
jgi:hypothetical protein